MKRRWHLVALGSASIALAIANPFNSSAGAATGPNFGSYTITATAPGWEMWEDEPSANAHPEGGGQAPYSTSALNSGGLGYGLSSVAWPGATEANIGSVALLLLGAGVPVAGQTIRVPDAMAGLAGQAGAAANYPIRAEARTGTPNPDSTFDGQAATLKAHADPVLANATATTKSAQGQSGFSFGNAETIASSALTDSAGQASAESKITKIDIGGVIKIDSVTSTATASTTAQDSQSSGATVVQGMKIAEQDAYVDERGVHIGQQGSDANAVASQIANQALKDGGFSFYVSQPQQETNGPTSSYTAGSLYIQWKPPQNKSENVFVIALGGARVSVTALPALATATNTVSSPTPFSPSPSNTPAATPSRSGGITSTPQTSASPAAAAAPTKPATVTGKPIAATFDGIAGQATLGVLGAGLLFFGFKRVATDIVDRVPSTCPLETS